MTLELDGPPGVLSTRGACCEAQGGAGRRGGFGGLPAESGAHCVPALQQLADGKKKLRKKQESWIAQRMFSDDWSTALCRQFSWSEDCSAILEGANPSSSTLLIRSWRRLHSRRLRPSVNWRSTSILTLPMITKKAKTS